MTDPTPLHRLADHWREEARSKFDECPDPSSEDCCDVNCAERLILATLYSRKLAASLAAIDVEAAAREVADEFWYQASVKPSELSVKKAEDNLTSRLRSAFVAGQAQGWETCPVSGKHEWGLSGSYLYSDAPKPEEHHWCVDCGILRSAVEKPATGQS